MNTPYTLLLIIFIIALLLSFFMIHRYSGSFVQRQKWIAIYHVKKFVKDSQLWKQTLSILPDFLENWHFISHFVWKSTKTLELLRIFDKLFDVINGEPFLTLYKTSAKIIYLIIIIINIKKLPKLILFKSDITYSKNPFLLLKNEFQNCENS